MNNTKVFMLWVAYSITASILFLLTNLLFVSVLQLSGFEMPPGGEGLEFAANIEMAAKVLGSLLAFFIVIKLGQKYGWHAE